MKHPISYLVMAGLVVLVALTGCKENYSNGEKVGTLIEFASKPDDPSRFMQLLDRHLREVNSDYDAKRTGDIFLAMPQLVIAPTGLFDRWLASTGKLGGQRKVPRLNNDRKLIDQMLQFIDQS
jgi:hypothetical protein